VTVAAPAGGDDPAVAVLTITEERLIELAAANVDRGADRIEQVYGWEVERVLAGVRATLAVAGSIVAFVVAAVLEEVGQVGARQITIALTGLCVTFGVVGYQHVKLRRLYGNYLQSLRVFTLVQQPEETDRWIHSPSA
jgi:hypothetical protein